MRLALLVTLLLAALPTHSGEFLSGNNTCSTTAAKQVSTNNQGFFQLTVAANAANTGVVYVGGVGVTTTTGPGLVAGASYNASRPSPAVNVNTLYFICSVGADGITWIGSR